MLSVHAHVLRHLHQDYYIIYIYIYTYIHTYIHTYHIITICLTDALSARARSTTSPPRLLLLLNTYTYIYTYISYDNYMLDRCSLCTRTFYDISTKNRHIRKMHALEPEKPFDQRSKSKRCVI
jgi:hypothetical protein